MLFLREGFVKATNIREDGSEHIVWIAGRYDIVPSEAFFSPRGRTQFDYSAMTPGTAYKVEKKYFLDEINKQPKATKELAAAFGEHYDTLLAHIGSINQPTVYDRLISTLYGLATRFCADDTCDFYQLGLPLTQQDIASLVGATRESISLELKALKRQKLVTYSRTSFVVNVALIRDKLQTPA